MFNITPWERIFSPLGILTRLVASGFRPPIQSPGFIQAQQRKQPKWSKNLTPDATKLEEISNIEPRLQAWLNSLVRYLSIILHHNLSSNSQRARQNKGGDVEQQCAALK